MAKTPTYTSENTGQETLSSPSKLSKMASSRNSFTDSFLPKHYSHQTVEQAQALANNYQKNAIKSVENANNSISGNYYRRNNQNVAVPAKTYDLSSKRPNNPLVKPDLKNRKTDSFLSPTLATSAWDPYRFKSYRHPRAYHPVRMGETQPGDLEKWARFFCLAVIEIINGTRPASSLARWADPEVLNAISRRHFLVQRITKDKNDLELVSKHHVVLKRIFYPVVGVAEVCAVIYSEKRARACALRLEAYRGKWKLIELEIG